VCNLLGAVAIFLLRGLVGRGARSSATVLRSFGCREAALPARLSGRGEGIKPLRLSSLALHRVFWIRDRAALLGGRLNRLNLPARCRSR